LPFRFVHTADIHLDSPLRSLALRDATLAETVGNATRTALTRIIDLCLDEQVDALLIAGDLYDGEQTSMKTALFLARELARLDAAGIRTFIIRGNHDAMSKITQELVLPGSVKVFGAKAEAVALESRAGRPDIVIHGLSFRESRAPESLLPRYRPPVEGAVNIGLMHTSLGGSASHDLYAPCSPADLDASGFRYWALGHIHQRSVTAGRATIVMPGIPQGRDINEAGAGSASLVTVADDGSITVEQRLTASARFDRLAIDISGETDWNDVVHAIGHRLGDLADDSGIFRVVRIRLMGATPLAWRIRRELDLLKTEADLRAGQRGGMAIEKLESDCVPLETKSVAGGGAVEELARLIDTDVLPANAFAELAQEAVNDLAKSLPPELRGLFGQDEAAFQAQLAILARDGVDTVLARLRDSGTGEA
jgi:DNA repair exonuclease SbcCD nuclease subunit